MEELSNCLDEILQKVPWGDVIQCLCAIAALILSALVFRFDRNSKKREYAIALFDKRYSIIESFSKLFKYSEMITTIDTLDDRSTLYNHQIVCDLVCDDNNIRAPRSYRVEHNSLLGAINDNRLGPDERHQKDMELMWLDTNVDNALKVFKSDLLSKFALSEYCFEKDYSTYLRNYVNSLFNYIVIFKDGSALDQTRSTKEVIDAINAINSNMVFDSMKMELKLLKKKGTKRYAKKKK